MTEEKQINLNLNNYEQKGLYLIFPDASRLELTRGNIERAAKEFWEDPDKIAPNVKKAIEFQRCPFCPLKGKDEFCDAIRPILPFLEAVDKYVSFDKVTAVYRGDDKNLLHIADTTMQEALKFVSLLSLMQYCQIGRKYWKYYFGIMPVEGGKDAAIRMYLNIYWLLNGVQAQITELISVFKEEIRITSENQVKRLNLICKNDAFMNAFVNTQIAIEFLSMDIDSILKMSFDNFTTVEGAKKSKERKD